MGKIAELRLTNDINNKVHIKTLNETTKSLPKLGNYQTQHEEIHYYFTDYPYSLYCNYENI